jgi:hypothetical protein
MFAAFNVRKYLGLAAAVLAPPALIALLSLNSAGRNLSTVLFLGSAVFFGLGLFWVGLGCWRNKEAPIQGGAVLFFSAALTLVVTIAFSMEYIGEQSAILVVTVRDAQTAQPLANALVRLSASGDGSRMTEGKTDAAGAVHLRHTFTAVGIDSWVQQTGVFYLWRETLQVEASGYEPIHTQLEDYTGPVWNLYGPPLPVVEVLLKRTADSTRR